MKDREQNTARHERINSFQERKKWIKAVEVCESEKKIPKFFFIILNRTLCVWKVEKKEREKKREEKNPE